MPNWKFFDWLTYGLLGLTAVLEALRAAGDQAPDLSEQLPIFYAAFWAYVPLVLIILATGTIVARAIWHRHASGPAADAGAPSLAVRPVRVAVAPAKSVPRPPYRLTDEQKRQLVALVGPLRPLQPRIQIKRSTAGAGNSAMDHGVSEVFGRAGFDIERGSLAPTAPNQAGLYVCYDAAAAQPPRFAAELALAFRESGLETNYAPLPPGVGAHEVMIFVGPEPL